MMILRVAHALILFDFFLAVRVAGHTRTCTVSVGHTSFYPGFDGSMLLWQWPIRRWKKMFKIDFTAVSLSENPQLVFAGVWGNRSDVTALQRTLVNSIFIFLTGENTDAPALFPSYSQFSDYMLNDNVALAFGFKKRLAYKISQRLVRLPLWLTTVIEPDSCEIPEIPEVDVKEWLARPYFASLLSSHASYPRTELFKALSPIGKVVCPGRALHNTEYNLLNSSLASKLDLFRKSRFCIVPENSLGEGYMTEKLVHALYSGCIPIYYSSWYEPQVFNAKRFIKFTGSVEEIYNRVLELQAEEEAAKVLSEPAYVPTANFVIQSVCHSVTSSWLWLQRRILNFSCSADASKFRLLD